MSAINLQISKQLMLFLSIGLFLSSCSSERGEQESDLASDTTDTMAASANRPPLPAENDVVAEIIESAVFTDLDGNEVTLADFRGKVLVLDFWETWCGPCLQVFPSMQQLIEEYPDDFAMLAVTLGLSEGPVEAREFMENHDYDFNYLVDSKRVTNEIGVASIPYKIYIDPDGKMIKQEIGSAGREGDYQGAKETILAYRN